MFLSLAMGGGNPYAYWSNHRLMPWSHVAHSYNYAEKV